MYEYYAYCLEVVDGDTMDVVLDLGFDLRHKARLRILNVDTHETYGVPTDTASYKQGVEETEFVEQWVPDVEVDLWEVDTWPLIVRTKEEDAFGRWLAEVERKSDGEVLHMELLSEFDDVEYSE